jgi:cytochrome c2
MHGKRVSIFKLTSAVVFALAPTASHPSGDHVGGHGEPLETMREMHSSHAHEHDFGVMDEMTDEQRERLNSFMSSVGLVMPPMSSHRGREIFLEKGCVVCHSINGVGGEVGPSLNAVDMPSPMNAFEFAARMWRGAPAMVLMQEDQLGEFINLTGEELADLVAFVHDAGEQEELSIDQVPEQFLKMLNQ